MRQSVFNTTTVILKFVNFSGHISVNKSSTQLTSLRHNLQQNAVVSKLPVINVLYENNFAA